MTRTTYTTANTEAVAEARGRAELEAKNLAVGPVVKQQTLRPRGGGAALIVTTFEVSLTAADLDKVAGLRQAGATVTAA